MIHYTIIDTKPKALINLTLIPLSFPDWLKVDRARRRRLGDSRRRGKRVLGRHGPSTNRKTPRSRSTPGWTGRFAFTTGYFYRSTLKWAQNIRQPVQGRQQLRCSSRSDRWSIIFPCTTPVSNTKHSPTS